MKTLVAPMLLGTAFAGECATPGGEDELPENPRVLVDLRSGERVAAYRVLAGDEEAALAESESVRLLHRKAQAECAKQGRRAGAPSRGDLPSLGFANPWPPLFSALDRAPVRPPPGRGRMQGAGAAQGLALPRGQAGAPAVVGVLRGGVGGALNRVARRTGEAVSRNAPGNGRTA